MATPAVATQWLSTNASLAATPTACSGVACQMTVSSADGNMLARAYSTKTASAEGTPGTQTGGWQAARIYEFSGGFGIKNNVTADTNEGIDPEHAVDNNQVIDVMVFELPTDRAWDIESFRLGWARESGVAAADVSAFFGGSTLAANFNFSDVCFSGCSGTDVALATLGGGFTNITSSITGGGYDVAESATTMTNFNTTQTGNYLIMTGRLGDQYDAFKIAEIRATGIPKIPEPGTFALLGLGLAGLVSLRRRQARG